MEKIKVAPGLFWVGIPEVNLHVMCGAPADSVKHLMKRGLIMSKQKDGVRYESGPNAILLSDVSVQRGSFSNLAEFPALQMFYRQGMLIPNHPNNNGLKPMLIGIDEQVKAQSHYIYRGNYGLVSEEEIISAGVSAEEAREMMRLKLRFAFDNIMKTEELLDTRVVDQGAIELRDGVFIHRKGFNIYEFMYGGEAVTVDMNLEAGEEYEPPYDLGYHRIRREYFSIIHTGEGDGWDVNRPCMASIIMFQGKIYLIDAGPSILNSLTSLGISVNEIEGIFHTHAHDDHFAGLTTLVRADHLIKYYATPLVRASVVKKLAALMGMDEERFKKYFDVRDLEFDKWNNVNGLDVKPMFSPHPVETSIMLFRALGENGYQTYAHWADTVAFDVLGKMVTRDATKSGVTQEFFDKVKREYLTPADLKKIDIGGSMIHGRAEDFIDDKSGKIILSHTALQLTDAQKEIGSNASFGTQDVLIPSQQDYTRLSALAILQSYFPSAPEHDISMLMNCPLVSFNAGTILIKKGVLNEKLYLILAGVVDYIDSAGGMKHRMPAGSLVGETAAMLGEPAHGTSRAASYVQAIQIPNALYLEFLKRNDLYENILHIYKNRRFLRRTWLLGEMVSYPIQNKIAQSAEDITFTAGSELSMEGEAALFILSDGEMQLFADKKLLEFMEPGDFTGEESVLFGIPSMFSARAVTDCSMFRIPGEAVENIPIVQWKLMETFDRRIRNLNTQYDFKWKKEYTIFVKEMDEQHKKLFEMINDLCKIAELHEESLFIQNLDVFISDARTHFDAEEKLMKEYEYPDTDVQVLAHKKLLEDLALFRTRCKNGNLVGISECTDFLKNWFVSHTLVEDKKYGPFLNKKGIF